MDIECIWKGASVLGESPLWDDAKQCLYWIDIGLPILNCLNIVTGEYTSVATPSPLCSIVLCKNGDLLATMGQQFVFFRQPDFRMDFICTLNLVDKNIVLNDGKCDAHGRFWVGTRDTLQTRPVSALYLFNESAQPEPIIENLIVSNGLGWSPDNKTFYLTDSIKKTIYKHPYELDKGLIGAGDIFIQVHEESIFPDGLAIDEEENIWVAMWGAGKIICYQKNGDILHSISLPAKNITSCCFGGKDFKTLYITSANIDFHGNTNLGKNAGCIFAVDVPIRGFGAHYYS
jgi:sugar lactone lactonase YvrE